MNHDLTRDEWDDQQGDENPPSAKTCMVEGCVGERMENSVYCPRHGQGHTGISG